ncbi:(+)-neomenthol dehydrogenase-like [Pyrus ussuriensis x Pyrus communis]|uniref:Short-chain dehydrogenase/reductase n=1 Tax=Pyrus ussuriensis x Pyrus communis TaxID=2448454 RepID=A0A5N5HGM5_9ROSA|nr:(+)-neomenthol dehydrogenase-like [Pyrus ussuriensis x Pyrus communis]
MAEATKRYAVVTGANKGVGFGTVKQLASNGIMVVLTARDEKRGLEALEKLKEFGVSDRVVFHQLDVTNSASIASLADFVKTQFGKLDILVNNAGINGSIVNPESFRSAVIGKMPDEINWNEISMTPNYELAEECLKTNYYGPKSVTEALLPLLKLSDSPRIINVSSGAAKLMNFPNGWAKEVLSDAESLTEERIDAVLSEFLEDYKQGLLETKSWPLIFPAYKVSKAALNAYTRTLAKKYPKFCINCGSPGSVKTDMTFNFGILTIDEGAESIVRLALLPNGGPTGLYFVRKEVTPF